MWINRHLARVLAPAVCVVVVATSCTSGRGTRPAPRALSPHGGDTATITNTDGKSIEDLFAGRFPGVDVRRTAGGGVQILIRGGANSFYGNEEPLYLLDETPLPAGSRGIVFLNPHDIEKIEVLKNPADLALYGVRGANGVVKITTKRPGAR